MSMTIETVTKRYGAVVAIRSASLTLGPGEIRALYGGNGSGKSTLAKIVGGTLRPDSGAVRLDGVDLPLGHPARVRAAGVAITYQELSLLPQMSVADNLAFVHLPGRFGFADRRAIAEDARAVLDRVGLAHVADLPVEALQVGEKYLVELAKLLLARPRVMVLDEITSALHDNEAAIVRRIIAAHRDEGGSALFVSHRVQEILEICDTITVMRNGESVADDAIAAVTAERLVQWAGGSSTAARPAATLPDKPEDAAPHLVVENLDTGRASIGFSAARGEILGFGGLPDQGQDEVLMALSGGRRVPHMRLSLDGARLRLASPADAVRQGIAFVAGDRDAVGFRVLSIADNIEAAHLNVRRAPALRAGEMHAALSDLSTVYASLTAPLGSLSGGNQQKVLLARCFVMRPKLLIAIDPTKGIDVSARAEVHRALRRLADEIGTCVLLSSSDDSELAGVCNRVLVMEEGRIKAELRRAGGGLTQDALVNAYLHKESA